MTTTAYGIAFTNISFAPFDSVTSEGGGWTSVEGSAIQTNEGRAKVSKGCQSHKAASTASASKVTMLTTREK